jgi:hypothetical protein
MSIIERGPNSGSIIYIMLNYDRDKCEGALSVTRHADSTSPSKPGSTPGGSSSHRLA